MKTCNRSYEAMVRDVVSRELGSKGVRLTPIPTYPDSVVYEGSSGDRSVIFKGVDPAGADPDGIALESWSCEAARMQDTPAPRVLVVDLTRAIYPGSFFVMEKVEGIRLDEAPVSGVEFDRIVRDLGRVLRGLHSVKLSGFGWLDEELHRRTGDVRGRYDSWRAAVTADIPEALEYLSSNVLSTVQAHTLRAQVEMVTGAVHDIAEPSLLHGDFGSSHVYIDPSGSKVTGIVDFGERASGDWVWDLCEWEPANLRALLDGYGIEEQALEEISDELDRYLLIKAVPWASKWYRRGETQVIDWLLSTMTRLATGAAMTD